jgi:hypothetical protein
MLLCLLGSLGGCAAFFRGSETPLADFLGDDSIDIALPTRANQVGSVVYAVRDPKTGARIWTEACSEPQTRFETIPGFLAGIPPFVPRDVTSVLREFIPPAFRDELKVAVMILDDIKRIDITAEQAKQAAMRQRNRGDCPLIRTLEENDTKLYVVTRAFLGDVKYDISSSTPIVRDEVRRVLIEREVIDGNSQQLSGNQRVVAMRVFDLSEDRNIVSPKILK